MSKKGGVVSKLLPAKSPKLSSSVDSYHAHSVLQDWERRDKRTLPFENFMRIVFDDQIDEKATENKVAKDLGLDHKTYISWRSSVSSASSMQLVIERIKKDPSLSAVRHIEKLKTDLDAQVAKASRASSPSGRSHAGMPSKKVFAKAVSSAGETILFRYAKRQCLLSGAKAISEARRMANDLHWAYSYEPERCLDHAWEALLKKLDALSSRKNEECLFKVTSTYGFEYGADEISEARLRDLKARVDTIKSQAERLAVSYVKLLEVTALKEDEWSDKSTLQFPIPKPMQLDPQISEYRLNQLMMLISKIASI
jgi:hypothetical protein